MKTQLTLTPDPIDELALIAEREMSDGMGAALVFHGVVRAQEDEVTIVALITRRLMTWPAISLN